MKIDEQIAALLQYDPPHEWRGGNLALIQSTEPEVMLAGPSETGKTWAACYKAHMACREYPGAQGALVRKVAASIPGTVLVTMKRIIGKFPVTLFGGVNNPERIIYPNGSQIWIGGMDNPTKVLSGERDFIQVCQAEELSVNDWETMTTRTTGRGAVMPYTQVFGDCNPGGSRHFLRSRPRVRMITSRHTDNPSLYLADGNLTDQGQRTLATLNELTGVRRKRLLEGIWATAEGAVYDMFDAAIHVFTRNPLEMRAWYLAVDEGYTNPGVILLVGEDADGRWHVFREFYERGILQADFVDVAVSWCEGGRIALAAVDSAAAGLIADMRNRGIPAVGAKGRVLDGIQKIQNRLKIAGDGRPRLSFDPSCVRTINDHESYVWKADKDEPVKENDHGCDPLRYLEDATGRAGGEIDDNPFEDYRG